MNTPLEDLSQYHLVKNAERKFNTLFEELQKMRRDNESPEFSNFIFLLETQLITIYYKRIMQNLKFIASTEPQTLSFNNKKELTDLAIRRLTKVLDKYDRKHITLLLKCTTLSVNEDL